MTYKYAVKMRDDCDKKYGEDEWFWACELTWTYDNAGRRVTNSLAEASAVAEAKRNAGWDQVRIVGWGDATGQTGVEE